MSNEQPAHTLEVLSNSGGHIVVRISNVEARTLTVVIEPWGVEHVIPTGGALDVIGDGPAPPQLDIQHEHGRILVYGWEGSVVDAVPVKPGGLGRDSRSARDQMTDKPPPKDPKDLATRTEQLAQSLLDTMNDPASEAARAEAEAEHDRHVQANLARYHATKRRAGAAGGAPSSIRRARSLPEMHFAASLEPCPRCGAPTEGLDLVGDDDAWALVGDCPRCKTPRAFRFRTYGDPVKGAYQRLELGGSTPSEIIAPGGLNAELDRLFPLIRPDPTTLAPAEWRASAPATDRAITCLNELLKFVPAGWSIIPADPPLTPEERADRAVRPERYQRQWLERERARLRELAARTTADASRVWALEERAVAALPELDVAQVQRWCAARVPEHALHQVRVECEVAPRHLTIIERRAPWREDFGLEWSSFPIARLRYSTADQAWTLYWRDRNLRFHAYDLLAPSRRVEDLLAEIDRDPTCIFWD